MLLENRDTIFAIVPVLAETCEDDLLSRQDINLRRSAIALVYELTEPLTAIHNYLEAAICLHAADTRAAAVKLSEVFEKTQTLTTRAGEVLHRLRDLLRHDEGTDDT